MGNGEKEPMLRRLQHVARGPLGSQIYMGLLGANGQLIFIRVCVTGH
jgi:hypothetical protein